jgi:flagellar assembly protein FliH
MGGVIRRECVSPSPAFSFDDLERRAREILARAHAEAARVLNDAEARGRTLAEAQRRQGYESGLAQGRQEGLEQVRREAREAALADARTELQRLTQALSAALAQFERDRRSLMALAESGLIELAAAIARRVCKTCVAASVEPARANVRALLEMVKCHADLEVHVHPAEHELLRDAGADLLQQTAGLEHVSIIADAAVERGGCVLRAREGVIDASIEVQLDRIAEALCGASGIAGDGARGAP